MKQIEGQMELQEYIQSVKKISFGCDCICRNVCTGGAGDAHMGTVMTTGGQEKTPMTRPTRTGRQDPCGATGTTQGSRRSVLPGES